MKNSTLLVILILVLGAAGVWYWYTQREEAVVEAPPLPVIESPPAVTAQPEIRHPVEAIEVPVFEEEPIPEPEPLPVLADSDPLVVETLSAMVGPEELERWFVPEGMVSRVVATIDRLDSRKIPAVVMPVKPPEGEYAVLKEGDRVFTSEANESRYAAHVALFTAFDNDFLVSEYRRLYPLFQQAYEEIGGPGAYFNDRLVEVIDHLLATPAIEQPLELVKPEAVWLFANPHYEGLSGGQKLLMRIGPENGAQIRAKLREVRAAVAAADDAKP